MTSVTCLSYITAEQPKNKVLFGTTKLNSISSTPTFYGGEICTIEDALHFMMLSSSNVAPNVIRAPIQTVSPMVNPIAQPMVQNMALKPATYTASTYRPTMRRNMGGILGNRQVMPVINNPMNNTTGYTTRTYRPRRL